jgi:N-acetylglucosaminyldiphosphoundecaprenol N-acetyl-beta-D-mannosaminyltransferase
MKLNIAGVHVDSLSRHEAVKKIDEFVQSGSYHYVVTPYSEFFVFARTNHHFRAALNKASLSLPDGIGVLWAAKFLSSPAPRHRPVRFLIVTWQLIVSLFRTFFDVNYAKTVIRERISGSSFIWDVTKLAFQKHYSLALVGGTHDMAQKAAHKLRIHFPFINIKLAISDRPFDKYVTDRIAASHSDILLIAYSPPKQELWLEENGAKLGVKVAFGLGGTFDYLGEKYPTAPHFWHSRGLEWAWRLMTQPWRIGRIWNAVPVFIWTIYKFKLKNRNLNIYDTTN